MIIVKLMGGLGNQMFQYALGRRLALERGVPLKLDLSWFDSHDKRKFELDQFNIEAEIAAREEIEKFPPFSRNRLLRGVYNRIERRIPYHARIVFREQSTGDFDPRVLKINGNRVLEGYWQSEKYFSEIRGILLREFVFKYEQDAKSREMAEQIQKKESVSLHIRRGDYVHDPLINQIHGLCSFDYYQKAVNYITEKMPNCHFYIFSDDHSWVCENFKLDYPVTLIDHNNASRNYEDLRLMSLCRHNIIANSTFSWWGAWLGTNPGKIVIAPQKWFNDVARDTKDLIPEYWVKIRV